MILSSPRIVEEMKSQRLRLILQGNQINAHAGGQGKGVEEIKTKTDLTQIRYDEVNCVAYALCNKNLVLITEVM